MAAFSQAASSMELLRSRRVRRVKKMPSLCSKLSSRWVTISVDAIIIVIVSIVFFLLEFGYLPTYKSGFRCNDPAIAFPFNGDTISITVLTIGCVGLPLFFMLVVECLRQFLEPYSQSSREYFKDIKLIAYWYREYLLGLSLTLLITEVTKFIYGEPRPHFLATCQPDAMLNCTNEYIYEYTCTNEIESPYLVRDCHRSFLSGHTSMSVFAGLFLFGYFQKRACVLRPWLLGPVLQLACLSFSLTCSLTRITDHRHHWWDVLAGAILGAFAAYYAVIVLCKNFVREMMPLTPKKLSYDNIVYTPNAFNKPNDIEANNAENK